MSSMPEFLMLQVISGQIFSWYFLYSAISDWKSLSANAFLNRGISMSLRLTPKAQRKNKLVIRTNGATYRRSVKGAELAILCKRTVQVHITPVDEHVLSGNVAGPHRNEKCRHRRNFFRRGHSFFQWNLGQNRLQFFLGLWKCRQPLPIKRRHHFSRKDSVHANAVVEQLHSPLTGEGQDCTF